MDKRIHIIMNGKTNLKTVLDNLGILLTGADKVLFYTISGESEFKREIQNYLKCSDESLATMVSYEPFNKYHAERYMDGMCPKIIGIKMPNSRFRSVSTALNHALEFVDKTKIAEYMHFFFDDIRIVNPDYSPDMYEWYMDMFNVPILTDIKTNTGNYIFKKLVPRFIFVSNEHLKSPVSFYQYEGRDHFIINRNKCKMNFDEKIKRFYVTEYLVRAKSVGLINHLTFYPDPVMTAVVKRDENLPYTVFTEEIRKEFAKDEEYMKNILHECIVPESSVDPLVDEHSKVIKDISEGA